VILICDYCFFHASLLLTEHAARTGRSADEVNITNERCAVVFSRLNLKFGIFTSSFGRLRQRIVLKCVPHVQHDYFSSFNQSDHCFLTSSLPLLSSLLKFPNKELKQVRRWRKREPHPKIWLRFCKLFLDYPKLFWLAKCASTMLELNSGIGSLETEKEKKLDVAPKTSHLTSLIVFKNVKSMWKASKTIRFLSMQIWDNLDTVVIVIA